MSGQQSHLLTGKGSANMHQLTTAQGLEVGMESQMQARSALVPDWLFVSPSTNAMASPCSINANMHLVQATADTANANKDSLKRICHSHLVLSRK